VKDGGGAWIQRSQAPYRRLHVPVRVGRSGEWIGSTGSGMAHEQGGGLRLPVGLTEDYRSEKIRSANLYRSVR
jgi:hypothetical protein